MEKLILEAENLLALRGHPNAVAFKVQCMARLHAEFPTNPISIADSHSITGISAAAMPPSPRHRHASACRRSA